MSAEPKIVDCAPVCCDMHNEHCEPPSELCCGGCTEVAHDAFPIRHADGSRCVLAPRALRKDGYAVSDEDKIDGAPRALRYPENSPRFDFWLLAEPAYELFPAICALRIERALDDFEARVRAEAAEELAWIFEKRAAQEQGPFERRDPAAVAFLEAARTARSRAGSSRDTTPGGRCSKCGNPQTKCSECDEPAQCGETTCVAHAWTVDTTPLATGGIVKNAGTYVLGDGSMEAYATLPEQAAAWRARHPDTTPEES